MPVRAHNKRTRSIALWVLVCWVWLATTTPFLHSGAHARRNGDRASISSSSVCYACEWAATERSIETAASSALPIPHAESRHFVSPEQRAAAVFFTGPGSRAPPASA